MILSLKVGINLALNSIVMDVIRLIIEFYLLSIIISVDIYVNQKL